MVGFIRCRNGAVYLFHSQSGKHLFRTKFEDELDKFKGNSGIESSAIQTLNPLSSTPTLVAFLPLCNGSQNSKSARTGNKTVGPKHALRRTQFGQNQSMELIASLLYKERHLSKELKMCISISKVLLHAVIDGRRHHCRSRPLGTYPIRLARKTGAYAATSESSSFRILVMR